jgi:hypothetical protein
VRRARERKKEIEREIVFQSGCRRNEWAILGPSKDEAGPKQTAPILNFSRIHTLGFCVSSKARRGMGRKANFFTIFYGGSKFIQILFSFIF